MRKVDILFIITLVGAFCVITTTGWLSAISGTITFISALLFGSEVHKIED